jgi:hypothetical protein
MSHTPSFTRTISLVASFATAAALFLPSAARAQDAPESNDRWEFTVPGGQLLPTGDQRDVVQRGGLTAVQLSYLARPSLAVTTTVGWARSRDVATADHPKLDVFMYDIGAELRAPRWIDGRVTFSPFVGIGGGARSYNYRSLTMDATHNLAAYASVGGEIGMGPVALRLEARNYLAGFKPLDGQGASETRNDVALLFGFRWLGR